MYIFQNLQNMADIPKELQNDIIKSAFSKAEFATMPKNQQENYHKNLKVYRDLVNSYDFALKSGHEEGMKKGLEQGLEQGLKQGVEQGIEKGIEQGIERGIRQRNIEVAKDLLSANMELELISKTTGLSIEEIDLYCR
jgi:predicted transposase YdaD